MFSGSSGYQPQKPQIDRPATVAQANEQYGNVQTGLGNQAAFLQAVQGQNGLANQASVFQQQQQLANQLQGQANGTGPNPAQAQLAQNTSNNTANQAALMAGQRGAGQNAGMIARQAANTGAQNQQNAVGQAATLQAQQQLAAQQQLMGQQQNMQGVAGNQVGTQANATNAYSGAAQNALNSVYGQINAQNNASIGAADVNNKAEATQHSMDNQMGQGFLQQMSPLMGPMGQMFGGSGGGAASGGTAMAGGAGDAMGGMSSMAPMLMMAASGGMAPQSMAGKHLRGAKNMKSGGPVDGQATVKGDSYANDTVPAMLSPGEIVIPRHITQGPNAAAKAAQFVQAVLAKGAK